jgi:hypothetical protein
MLIVDMLTISFKNMVKLIMTILKLFRQVAVQMLITTELSLVSIKAISKKPQMISTRLVDIRNVTQSTSSTRLHVSRIRETNKTQLKILKTELHFSINRQRQI